MSPLLATRAGASARGFGWGMKLAAAAENHVLIASQTVGAGGAASITFSNIPQTYKHLQVRGIHMATNSYAGTNCQIRFNGDAGTSYARHQVYGDGTDVGSNSSTAQTFIFLSQSTGTGVSGTFAVSIVDILDYASTSKNKVVRTLGGWDANSNGGQVAMRSGVWLNTTSVTSIALSADTYNLAQYSRFDLYGIAG